MAGTDDYHKLILASEKARRESDQAQGALNQVMERLKEEFDCDSIEEAKKLQGEMDDRCEAAEQRLLKSLADFETKWGDQLRPF